MKKPSRQNVTLKDVARATGYSVNTISRALRGKEDIAGETREKIKTIAAEMGYISNAIASSLRLGHTNMIAIILGDVSNPHFGIMMKEMENRARQYGYCSFLINTNENDEMEREAIQAALNKGVDGIVICPAQHSEENICYLMNTGVPFVQVGRYFANLPASYVVCNDELGGYQATHYLLGKGHREILMLGGPSYISSARERLAGYVRAHREAGIPLKPELMREVPITANGCAETVAAIIREKVYFTGIFGFSDMIAWDAWTHLKEHGYKIPQDYSLIGFDNIQSRLSIPFHLSTISSYKTRMSTTAVDCLICKMQGEEVEHTDCAHVIDTELVEGETVRAFNP